MPFIPGGTSQRRSPLPAILDVFHSDNVIVNGVPVALWGIPLDSPSQAAANFSVTQLDEIYFTDGPDAAAQAIQALVTAKILTQEQVNAGKAAAASTVGDQTTSTFTGTSVASDCTAIHKLTEFPDGLVITPNGTTLGSMIRAVQYPYSIVAQNGLTKADIVCNLSNLALNIWEPVKAQYPDAFIGNSFRVGTGKSQHGRGQAMDVKFHGLSSTKYIERAYWMRDNLPFDQMIMETSPGGDMWIHISYYSGTGTKTPPQNKLGSMIHGANFVAGLADLSSTGVRSFPSA
jgi:hypothetical protein